MNSLDRVHTRAQYSALMHPGSSLSLPRTWNKNCAHKSGSMSSLAAEPALSRNTSNIHRICKVCDPQKSCLHGCKQVADNLENNNVTLTGDLFLYLA